MAKQEMFFTVFKKDLSEKEINKIILSTSKAKKVYRKQKFLKLYLLRTK